jgi:hypothetical protein
MAKLLKNNLVTILILAVVGFIAFNAMGQSEETSPNVVPLLVKELGSLQENKTELETKLKAEEKLLSNLKSINSELGAASYPTRIEDSLETLMGLEPSSDAMQKAENTITAFHDPFFDVLMGEGHSPDEPEWKIYNQVEKVITSHEDALLSAAFSTSSDLELVNSSQDKKEIYSEFVGRLREDLSETEFNKVKKDCQDVVTDTLQDVGMRQTNAKKQLTALAKDTDKLSSQLKVSETKQVKKQNLDESLFKWGLPVIICFILALTLINAIPRILAIFKNQPEMVNEHAEHNVLNTVTVFLLIITVLILGIRGQIDNASLSTLLAGISGYVLGNVRRSKEESEDRETKLP